MPETPGSIQVPVEFKIDSATLLALSEGDVVVVRAPVRATSREVAQVRQVIDDATDDSVRVVAVPHHYDLEILRSSHGARGRRA